MLKVIIPNNNYTSPSLSTTNRKQILEASHDACPSNSQKSQRNKFPVSSYLLMLQSTCG
jgi:hypothetical protein